MSTDVRGPTSTRWLLFNLAWPVILEGLLQTLLGLVDTLRVGRLGLLYVWGGFLVLPPLVEFLTWRRFRRGDWKGADFAGAVVAGTGASV